MLDRETINKFLKVTMTPSMLAALFFMLGVPLIGINVPLVVTAICVAFASANLFMAFIATHYALDYDGTHKAPDAMQWVAMSPFIIAFSGVLNSGLPQEKVSELSLAMLVAIVIIMLCSIPVRIMVGRKYKPIYASVQREMATNALGDALDKVPNLSATARTEIETRMKGASTADIRRTAHTIQQTGELAPELLK